MSGTVTASTCVNAPIWSVYKRWRQLERFPEFVPTVKEARWLKSNRLYWRETHAGTEYESTFEIDFEPRENRLRWRSISGPVSSGVATCEAMPRGGSRLTLTIHFDPDTEMQSPEVVEARHNQFLAAFKQYIERGGESR